MTNHSSLCFRAVFPVILQFQKFQVHAPCIFDAGSERTKQTTPKVRLIITLATFDGQPHFLQNRRYTYKSVCSGFCLGKSNYSSDKKRRNHSQPTRLVSVSDSVDFFNHNTLVKRVSAAPTLPSGTFTQTHRIVKFQRTVSDCLGGLNYV